MALPYTPRILLLSAACELRQDPPILGAHVVLQKRLEICSVRRAHIAAFGGVRLSMQRTLAESCQCQREQVDCELFCIAVRLPQGFCNQLKY